MNSKGMSRYGPTPRVKAYQSTGQSAPTAATWTPLAFNSQIFNYGGFTFALDGGGNKTGIIVPVKGMYRTVGRASTVANSQSYVLALTVNNTTAGTGHTWGDGTIAEGYTGATASNGVSFPNYTLEQVAELAAGDKIGMEWYQSVGPQAGVAGCTWLFVELLEPDLRN